MVEVFEIEENELEKDGPGSQPNYNVAPTTDQPVVIERAPRPSAGDAAGGETGETGDTEEPQPVRRLKAMHWGLIPSWAKDASIGNRMINARADRVFETAAYRRAIRSRRCLIPADGWYEWQKSPTEKDAKGKPRKQPFYTTLADGGPLAFGGVYELWRDRSVHDDDPAVWVFSYTIITTEAESGLDVIHDRMPFVVDRERWDEWLSPDLIDPDGIRALMQPHEPGRFVAVPITNRVNSVRNNGPELIEPADLSQLHGVVDPATGELIGAGSEPLF
jgi:putative SOS response-associated peptidase YedK